ncbi:MAG: hypothetical protein FWD31_00580 [Planctomycetaceae bacterium]|nr:hypothetical protein [Planctomycetaceae bacterium]
MYDVNYNYFSWYEMLQQLYALVPNAKWTFDTMSANIVVWGTDEEQQMVKETIENIHNTEPADRFGRFPIRRADPYEIIRVVQQMLPNLQYMYDTTGKTLIIQSMNSEQLKLVAALIEKLDPEEPGPNDPQVQFYQLRAVAPDYLISTLKMLAPEATITQDDVNRQLMVVARPAEHELIRRNVDLIISTFTPDEPVLFLYTVTDDQRKRVENYVQTANEERSGLAIRIIEDSSPGQMSILAKPLGHQLIAEALLMMSANTGSDFELQLEIFSLTAVDRETVEEFLTERVPEAKPIFDDKGMRVMVWAAKSEMNKVKQIFQTLDPTSPKGQTFMRYPIALGEPENVLESIKQVYPNIKATVDDRNKLLLIWATPEEHAAITEMFKLMNEPMELTLQERYRSYPIPKLYYYSVQNMLEALFPGVEVYSDALSTKITIRATSREHQDIETLLTQMQSTDDQYHPEFNIYPMGDADPVTLEALLQGMFPDAESITSYEIKDLLQDDAMRRMIRQNPFYRMSMSFYMNQQNMMGNMMRQQTAARFGLQEGQNGFFKVDPGTRSVIVFLPENDQKKIASMMESLTKLADTSGKMTVKMYDLERGSLYIYIPVIQEIVPTAKLSEGWGSEIIVYASAEDHAIIKQYVDQMNELEKPGSRYSYSILTIPDGSNIPRESLIRQVWSMYRFSGNLQNGPLPNQIIFMGRTSDVPKVQKYLDDLVAQQSENKALPQVYTLKYITVTNAIKWLKETVPNAQYEMQAASAATSWQYQELQWYANMLGIPLPTQQQAPDDPTARSFVVRATPLDHEMIAEMLEILDVDLPEEVKPVPRDHSFVNYPPPMMTWSWWALQEAFPPPKASFVMNSERIAIVAIAIPSVHKEIDDFIKEFVKQKQEEQQVLQFYILKNTNFFRVTTLLNQLYWYNARGIQSFQGATPEQLLVYARPVDQAKIAEIIAKMETMILPENLMTMKAYHVAPEALEMSYYITQSRLTGAIVIPNFRDNTLIIYGSEDDHRLAEEITEAMGESFPEHLTKVFFVKNIPVGEAFSILTGHFSNRGVQLYIRQDTGDLVAHATPKMMAEIEKNIALIDVPRPPESEKYIVMHDLSDLPIYFRIWATSSMQYVSPGVLVLPSATNGQILVYATPVEQVKIQKVVDEMLAKNDGMRPVTENYEIKFMPAVVAWNNFLAAIDPTALPAFSSIDPHKITILASPSQHEKLAEAIDKLNENDTNFSASRLYRLEHVTLTTALSFLRTRFPDVTFTQDWMSNSNAILVTAASNEEQEKIAEILAEIDTFDDSVPDNYTLNGMMATIAWNYFLANVAPNATPGFSNVDPYKLTIWATPSTHERIREAIDKLNEDTGRGNEARMYRLQRVGFYAAYELLLSRFPGMYIMYDRLSNSVIAFGTPEEHKIIADLLAEIDTFDDSVPDNYTLNGMRATLAWYNFISVVAPNATPGFSDVDPYKLTIWATPSTHERIREAIDKLNEDTGRGNEARMYRLQRVSWSTAYQILSSRFPGMSVYYDTMSNSVVAYGTPEEHKIIDAIVAEMDRYDPESQTTIQIHNIGSFASQFWPVLRTFYRGYGSGQYFDATPDATGRSLFVTATPQQHKEIASLIKQMHEGGLNDPNLELKVYDFDQNLNMMTVLSALSRFFYFEGVDFNPVPDWINDKMMLLARPQEHENVRMIMESFRTEERKLDIFALRELDPQTVITMVGQLFLEDPIQKRPTITPDFYSDLLYIRATESQHVKIRELLAQFGETGELLTTVRPVGYQQGASQIRPGTATTSSGLEVLGTGVMRTIQIDGGNPDELIERLQKIWEQINPDNPFVPPNKDDDQQQQPAPGPTSPAPAQPSIGFRAPQGMTGTDGPLMIELDKQQLSRMTVLPQWDAIAYVSYAEPVSPMQEVPLLSATQPVTRPTTTQPTTTQPTATQPTTTQPATTQPTATPPTARPPAETATAPAVATPATPDRSLYVFVNDDGSLSLVSNDTAALDRLTAALAMANAGSQPPASGNTTPAKFDRVVYDARDYTEYAIRNLAPTVLVDRLQMRMNSRFPNRTPATMQQQGMGRRGNMGAGGFDPTGFAMSGRPPMPGLTAYDATNSIIVTGSRRDRAIVEELIDQLDVPDPIYEPKRVVVKNSDANKVLQQLLATYSRYLQTIRLPNGVRPSVGLDSLTNSIVIMGPDDLVETLTKYIETTDLQLHENPPRKITVIQPDSISANVLQTIIQELFKGQNPMHDPFGSMYPGYGGYGGGYGGYGGGYGGTGVPPYNMPGNYGRSPYY